MNQIDNITDSSDQIIGVVLGDGSLLSLELFYNPATERWVMDVSHPLLTVSSVAVCVDPNLLRAWRNVIPFGIACTSLTGIDPTMVGDFLNGTASLYVLDASDVQGVEANIFRGVLQ